MGTGGLSATRLRRMHDVMAGHVERGAAPGLVTLVSRHGEVHVDAVGALSFGGAPMGRDTIFRISSMTKPVIAAAAMLLVEECVLRLDDPVDRLLPELADREVLTSLDAPVDQTEPAHRAITVRDLLSFRLGFGVLVGPPGADVLPIQQAVEDAGIGTGPPNPTSPHTPDTWIAALGTLPLMHQPGEKWMYNTGSDVLGVLIARASGQPLETFLRERVFEPLGMVDTAFSVPSDQIDRFATSYVANPVTDELSLNDEAVGGGWSSPPAFPAGSSGLVSTVDDYLAFGAMMLARGRYDGGRLLSRPSVELMTTDQLTPEQKAVSGFWPGYFDNIGWGFGVAVGTRRDTVSSVPGRYGWDGGLGTSWWSDPEEDMVGILMTQRMAFPLFSPPYQDFWTSAYQAIDD